MSGPSREFVVVNARVAAPAGTIERGYVHIKEDKIAAIGSVADLAGQAEGVERIDAGGAWLIPGFVDVHVHGGANHDFMDADEEGIREITKFHASNGTTSMLATTLTAPREELTAVIALAADYMSKPMPYAKLVGVHLEGPFVNVKWKGAQNPAYILPPQPEWLEEWVARFPGVVKLQTLAPEIEGSLDYIEKLAANGIVPSCGHTDATYDQIIAAADRGLRHAVHTFNAMTPLHHRNPGTVGAVLTDDRITAEVIADGHHVHPAGVKLITRAKGVHNVILVTDAMAAAGMPDGDYDLGGLPVHMKCGVARLKENDSLAGSTLTMISAVRFLVREIGVSLEEASLMASANPARQLGLADSIGTLEAGKQADFLLLNDDLDIQSTWIDGKKLFA
ncbi:N-acetylglucosamine-6-phosphate deacetylase [Cohnella sp. CIP 111063]|uniref:N-acetylglucosamine-6-phosphate deacetylase n=1 Tax=unclassified Cohnella TaxID=2636738 RepID=UPI000B8C57ED|nr:MULTISPECIES: N-acetylglucosamine-6-phosphate deacetylase [unclassified Cohnella]OXS56209.1 N-acetylglucosamine-6-phosphate deacetylase [Cohnella sp. CIP 111063]PRX67844.1 N-acetylglucosamine-6-phosphate deacetylase [Cohnella sp. SGD-V74]